MTPTPTVARPAATRRQALLVCGHAALTVLACSVLCAAAILLAAPAAVVPFIVGCCIGLPILASWRLPEAIGVLRLSARAADSALVAELRRALSQIPETEHPFGF